MLSVVSDGQQNTLEYKVAWTQDGENTFWTPMATQECSQKPRVAIEDAVVLFHIARIIKGVPEPPSYCMSRIRKGVLKLLQHLT